MLTLSFIVTVDSKMQYTVCTRSSYIRSKSGLALDMEGCAYGMGHFRTVVLLPELHRKALGQGQSSRLQEQLSCWVFQLLDYAKSQYCTIYGERESMIMCTDG